MNNINLKLKIRNREFVLSCLLYIVLFIFLLYPYRDYDWGWHYKYGEYFFKHGSIYLSDTFSWTMKGYVWVNHEWLYDPLHYLIFKNFSFLGMSVAGALVSIVWFYLGIKRYKLTYWKKAILALFFANLVQGVIWQGLRSQMIGILFLSVLIYYMPEIISGRKRILFALPVFFLVFANFHGYFVLGLAIAALMILGTFISDLSVIKNSAKGLFIPKNLVFASVALFASVIATIVNPFYYYVYIEAVKHASSPLLKYITEWTPAQLNSVFFVIFVSYTAFLVFGFVKRRTIRDLPWIFVSLFLLYLALGARRYIAPYMVLTLPMAALFLSSIPLKLEKYRATTFVFLLAIIIGLEIGFFRRIPSNHLLNYTFEDYCNFGSKCSEGLTAYLKKNPPRGRGFNFYDWGGYLIGRNVPVKLFIDGRMHLWEASNGFQPFLSYEKMFYEKDYVTFNKYNFDFLIIPKDSLIVAKMSHDSEIGRWKAEYYDDTAVYLVRQR